MTPIPVSDATRQGSAILASRARARQRLAELACLPEPEPPAPVAALPVPPVTFRCDRCGVAFTFPASAEREAA